MRYAMAARAIEMACRAISLMARWRAAMHYVDAHDAAAITPLIIHAMRAARLYDMLLR